jgi:hypothetical protein
MSLCAFVEERHNNDTYQLTNFKDVRGLVELVPITNTDNFQFDKLKPILNEKPTYWRLTVPTSESTQIEELVLSMQGVIVNKDLPPILIK